MTEAENSVQNQQWANAFPLFIEKRLNEVIEMQKSGKKIDKGEYDSLIQLQLLSCSDFLKIIEAYTQDGQIFDPDNFLPSDLVNIALSLGLFPTFDDQTQPHFESKVGQYLKDYKVDRNSHGKVNMIRQMVHDELVVKKDRQRLHMLDLSKIPDVDKEEQRKPIIDRISKLNKSNFEFTKYFEEERRKAVEIETQEKAEKEQTEKTGVSINRLLEKLKDDPRIEKAKEIQKAKSGEYVRKILEGTT